MRMRLMMGTAAAASGARIAATTAAFLAFDRFAFFAAGFFFGFAFRPDFVDRAFFGIARFAFIMVLRSGHQAWEPSTASST